jgi:hypothetical protein
MREIRYKLAVFVPSNAVVYISEGSKETNYKKVSGTTVIIEHGKMALLNFIASSTDDSIFGLYRMLVASPTTINKIIYNLYSLLRQLTYS